MPHNAAERLADVLRIEQVTQAQDVRHLLADELIH
jgi:hypothetical protein